MNLTSDSVLQQAIKEEQARLARFKRAWHAYQGNPPKPLYVSAGGVDDNVLIDNPRTIVDKGVSFLFGKDFEQSLPDGTDGDEEWLEQAWQDAGTGGRSLILQKLGVNGGVCGHTFAKLQPVEGRETPRVLVVDPSIITPSWDQDDVESVWRWRLQWTIIERATGKPAVRRQTIELQDSGRAWETIDEISRGDSTQWTEIGRSPWPFEWAPIIDAQNMPAPNEYWGLADLEPSVLDLAEAINRVVSHVAKIVRVHAFPKPWVKGMVEDQAKMIDMGIDRALFLPAPDAEIGYLEMKSDISASLDLLRRLKEAWHEITQVPEVASGKLDNVGQLSGLALGILYGPLVDRTETKRLTVGTLPEQISARMLAWRDGSSDLPRVETHWPELIPADPKAEAETLQLHKDLGVVSDETIADKLGYDYDTERERIDNEAADAQDNGLVRPAGPVVASAMMPGPPMGTDGQAGA